MQIRKFREGSERPGESSLWAEADPVQPRSQPQVHASNAALNKQNSPRWKKKEKKNRESHLNIGAQYLHSVFQLIMLFTILCHLIFGTLVVNPILLIGIL